MNGFSRERIFAAIRQERIYPMSVSLLFWGVLVFLVPQVPAGQIWCDGTRTDDTRLPGKLLSENPGYWGPSICTGVAYTYKTEPTNPPDRYYGDPNRYGRRLLDGKPAGDWHVPVGVNYQPLVVIFDFKRPCRFSEVDVAVHPHCRTTDLVLEVADDPNDSFSRIFYREKKDCPDKWLHRIPLAMRPAGRYLRVTQGGNPINYMCEVYVWGEGEVSQKYPEADSPLYPCKPLPAGFFQAYRGMENTDFSAERFQDWLAGLGEPAKSEIIWAPYQGAVESLFPNQQDVNQPVKVLMARNEYEDVFVTMTNTSLKENRIIKLDLSSFKKTTGNAQGMAATLRVAGVVQTAHRGVVPRPLFSADNMLSPGLMRRYLLNGDEIADFPHVKLPPGGSVLIGISLSTHDAEPGLYKAQLRAIPGSAVDVEVEVLDVKMPTPRTWIHTWSMITSMSPFTTDLRNKREVEYKRDEIGATVWYGLPEPGSVSALAYAAGRTYFIVSGPRDEKQDIESWTSNTLKQAQALGLSYDEWYIELWDEPGPPFEKFRKIAERIKGVDAEIGIYCNPLFWVSGKGWQADEDAAATLCEAHDWYNRLVDVSVPHSGSEGPTRPLSFAVFDHPRWVRAFYSHPGPNREYPWIAFKRGWEGWGNYSYYAPRADPWDDLDHEPWRSSSEWFDYQYVYPGPTGPIPTFQAISLREGWEDYRLLTLLRRKGKTAVLEELLQGFKEKIAWDILRGKALQAVAGSHR